MSYSPPPPPPPPGQGGQGPGDQGGYGGYGPGGPGGPGGYGPGGPGGYGYSQPQQNQKALWSMILGILGLVCCGIFAAVPALILGNNAKKEIAASGGAQTGEGLAKAGVILGWIGIALSLLSLVLFATGAFTFNFDTYNTP